MPARRRASARRYWRYGSGSACRRCYRCSSGLCLPPHHDDFFTPGTCPCDESVRKQMRQIPNFRMYARGRPHRLQRLCCETACLCLRSPRFTVDFLATQSQPHFLKGNPSSASSARASSSVRAVVTKVTSRPRNLSILSYSISVKTSTLLSPIV